MLLPPLLPPPLLLLLLPLLLLPLPSLPLLAQLVGLQMDHSLNLTGTIGHNNNRPQQAHAGRCAGWAHLGPGLGPGCVEYCLELCWSPRVRLHQEDEGGGSDGTGCTRT